MRKTKYFLEKDSYRQSPGVVLSKRCSVKFRKSLRKTLVPEFFFDKVSGWRLETLLKKRLRCRCFFPCRGCRIFYANNLGQSIVDKFWKLSKNRCFHEMSQNRFFIIFLGKLLKFSIRVASWSLPFNSKRFWDFIGIF